MCMYIGKYQNEIFVEKNMHFKNGILNGHTVRCCCYWYILVEILLRQLNKCKWSKRIGLKTIELKSTISRFSSTSSYLRENQ